MGLLDRVLSRVDRVGLRTGRNAARGAAVVVRVVALFVAGVVLGAVILVWAMVRGAMNKNGAIYY